MCQIIAWLDRQNKYQTKQDFNYESPNPLSNGLWIKPGEWGQLVELVVGECTNN